MPGGFIFEKDISSDFQGGKDKSLIIDPNYAYQVPFNFGSEASDSWEDIKIGMFVSYVQTGAGVDSNNNAINGNSGVTSQSTFTAGGISVDTFNYVGIMRSGAAGDNPSLPLTTVNSGFLGLQADKLYVYDASTNSYNKLMHSSESVNLSDGDARFIATNGANLLESKEFKESQGNFNVVALKDSAQISSTDACTENTGLFCDYWGMRFQVLNKGLANQQIRFTASINGTAGNQNSTTSSRGISDPSLANLKSLVNGVGEFSYTTSTLNMGGATAGFQWNDGTSAYPIPDSLFFYNAFQDLRPRIHAWAIKKIS